MDDAVLGRDFESGRDALQVVARQPGRHRADVAHEREQVFAGERFERDEHPAVRGHPGVEERRQMRVADDAGVLGTPDVLVAVRVGGEAADGEAAEDDGRAEGRVQGVEVAAEFADDREAGDDEFVAAAGPQQLRLVRRQVARGEQPVGHVVEAVRRQFAGPREAAQLVRREEPLGASQGEERRRGVGGHGAASLAGSRGTLLPEW